MLLTVFYTNCKAFFAFVIAIMLFCLIACGNIGSDPDAPDNGTTGEDAETSVTSPTGFPVGTVQNQMLYLNGQLYYFEYYLIGQI